MHNLRHFYYQNKEKIWKVVLIIASILGIIYFVDNSISEKSSEENIEYQPPKEEIYYDAQNNTYISDKSAISGGMVTETEVKKINSTISKFLQYCKNGNIEDAYNMLSADCKENEYNTLEKFQNQYVKNKFNKDDTYEIENWIHDTYKISISKDLLATGEKNTSKKIEYITIIEENSEKKLNINSYIGKTDLNKEVTQNGIKVIVLNKQTYMDYEIYNFQIENLSNKTIKLDNLEKIGTMHLEDYDRNTYNAYANELIDSDLEIKSKFKFNISIKYGKTYSTNAETDKIIFENVILDYVEYKKTENKNQFKNVCKIEIDL